MTLAKRRNVVNKILICFYEMFYRNFLSLNVLKNRFFFVYQQDFSKSFLIVVFFCSMDKIWAVADWSRLYQQVIVNLNYMFKMLFLQGIPGNYN